LLCTMVFIATNSAVTAGPPPGASSCSGCHPPSIKVNTPVPRIVGRQPAEIIAAMKAFRSGDRPSTVMGRIAKGFSEDEIQAIAVWLAAQYYGR
jgi:cytochrome subunit of sulfide dehydrogenase